MLLYSRDVPSVVTNPADASFSDVADENRSICQFEFADICVIVMSSCFCVHTSQYDYIITHDHFSFLDPSRRCMDFH